MSEVLALGLSHKTAPLALRERAAMTEGRAAGCMRDLVGEAIIDEAVVISTCNRTEIYLATSDPVAAESAGLGALAGKAEIAPTELVPRIYVHHGADAVRHLFQVTSGLDSVVIGEAEIQGQVKRAYELALVEGVTGPILNRLFQSALGTGGRVRSETALGHGSVSLSSIAVEVAEDALGELQGVRVMLVGAGETARLVARALTGRGAESAFIANRHHDRARQLAAEHGGEALSLEEMRLRLADADLLISATGSPHHVLEPEHVELAGPRNGRPLLMIDLAVPRDIDPACRDLAGVTVFDIDDLQALIERNSRIRERDGDAAKGIVEQEVERFQKWWDSLRVLPTVAAMRQKADEIVRQALADNENTWSKLSREEQRRLQAMVRSVANRLIDEPIQRLKSADESLAEAYAALLQELFDLEATRRSSPPPSVVTDLEARRRRSWSAARRDRAAGGGESGSSDNG